MLKNVKSLNILYGQAMMHRRLLDLLVCNSIHTHGTWKLGESKEKVRGLVIGTVWKLTFSSFRNTMLRNLINLAFWKNKFWLSFIKQISAKVIGTRCRASARCRAFTRCRDTTRCKAFTRSRASSRCIVLSNLI